MSTVQDMDSQTLPVVIMDTCPTIPQKNLDPAKVCVISCKYDGKTTAAARIAGHVHCSLCFHKYHKDCINFPNDFNSYWPCPTCRSLSADVKNLQTKLDSVISQNESLLQINTQQQIMINSLKFLETKVTALSSHMIPESEDLSDDEDDMPDAEPEGHLLIGDSLIRDVVPTTSSLAVDSTGGATLAMIRKKLKAINPKQKKYQKVFIVAGTNDTTSKCPTVKIANNYRVTINAAKRIAAEIIVSSIPPRADNRADKNKIDTVNQLVLTIANQEKVTFVNHDDNFLFRNDTIDMSLLLPDRLHLSANGVRKLVSNLKLKDKAKSKMDINKTHGSSVNTNPRERTPWNTPPPAHVPLPLMSLSPQTPTSLPPTSTPCPILFRGSSSSLSNFFPTPISIWNMDFRSSEHAYQYYKCITLKNNTAATNVLTANTPLDAKKIGDSVNTTTRWHDIKQGVMYKILRSKSRQCPQYVQDLKDSHDRLIIEDTTHPYWGRGRDGQGLNMLGKLHMMLRAELSTTIAANNFTPRPSVAPPRNQQGHTVPQSLQQQLHCLQQ